MQPHRPNDDSWARALSKEWTEIDAKAKSAEEIEKIFAPHLKQLADAGHTPASYVRMLVGVARELDQNPRQTLATLAGRYGLDGAMTEADVHRLGFEDEWERFARRYPDAASLRENMAHVLMANPEKPGEPVGAALERAYRAAGGTHQTPAAAPEPTTRAEPSGPDPKEEPLSESSEPKNWRDEASAAWDEVLGDAESISDSDEDDEQHAE